MTEFDQILNEITAGKEGRNHSISMGFHRLNKYIGIRKKIMTLVFGSTGSGKSSLVYDAWILNPFDWYMANKDTSKIKMKVVLFSFERSKIYTKAKWVSRKVFKDTGILIPIEKMLGWWDNNKLTHDEHDLIVSYKDYINELCEFVTILEGADNPTGPYKYMKQYAETHGKEEPINEHRKVYLPDNEYEIVVPIIDHIGLTKLERGYTSKKESIDKLTEYAQGWRDHYGYSPVFVAQLTRELGSVQWQKMQEFEPSIDQVKESGSPGEAADTIISLFDPLRYNTKDMGGYEAEKFVNLETGAKHFRSIKIQKNTYGTDGVRCGMAFHGPTGMFLELPHKNDVNEETYRQVTSGEYFREKEAPLEYSKKPFSGFSQNRDAILGEVNNVIKETK